MTGGAFQACFADLRLIKGRKCVQLIFEVPVEQADRALEILGGMPDPSKSVWCGIARINPGAVEEPTKSATEPHEGKPRPGGPGRGTHPDEIVPDTKRLVRQAAMCCADPLFQTFLRESGYMGETGHPQELAGGAVRHLCGVKSRSEILPGTKAADLWGQLHSKFLTWKLVE